MQNEAGAAVRRYPGVKAKNGAPRRRQSMSGAQARVLAFQHQAFVCSMRTWEVRGA